MEEFNTQDPMATNSMILKREADGTMRGIYCHYDGDLGHVGRILFNHYKDPAKVDRLIDLGYIEMLGEEVSPDPNKPHTTEAPQSGVTLAYYRDLGQGDEPRICTYQSVTAFDDTIDNEHCNYYYRDGMWMYREARQRIWIAMTEHLVSDYNF